MTRRRTAPVGERGQRRALAGAFLARLFDNDLTGGANDLRSGYLWLIGMLAAPPFFAGLMMLGEWDTLARFSGIAVLHEQSLSGKVLYIAFGMVTSGVLAALTWNNLLLDRRDALILGTLPVRPATVVGAKLVALARYLALLAVAMHGLSALSFGVGLAVRNTFSFLVHGVIAHFIAATAGTVLVMTVVIALQGLLIAAIGPRAFSRLAAVLQVSLVASTLMAFAMLPVLAISTRDTLAGAGVNNRPWLLWTPPFWFLGTYETVLGADHRAVFSHLHWRGLVALGIAGVLAWWSYAVVYARIARAAVEGSDSHRPRRASVLVELITVTVTRHPVSRAAVQFFLTSLARVDRLRFVAAISVGVVVGWSGPVVLFLAVYIQSPRPPSALLGLSLADVALLVTGLRIAAAMPCDLGAAWIVPASAPAAARLRAATWRALFVLGVVPTAAAFGVLLAWVWGPGAAIRHALMLAASGALLVEILLWNYERMPGTHPWRPERIDLGTRWPLYALAFVTFSTGLAAVEHLVFDNTPSFAAFVAGLTAAFAAVRAAHARRLVMPVEDDEPIGAPAVLGLD